MTIDKDEMLAIAYQEIKRQDDRFKGLSDAYDCLVTQWNASLKDKNTLDVEPSGSKCIVTDIYFENNNYIFGVLTKIGIDAFKDEKRFKTDDMKLKIGMKVSFMKIYSMALAFKINDEQCYFVEDNTLSKVPQNDN
jgi:hypothetical protein